MKDFIIINQKDNVAVALKKLPEGYLVNLENTSFTLWDEVPYGHKFAIEPIRENENIRKYGAIIGHATTAIMPGNHVHTHNMKTNLSGTQHYSYHPKFIDQHYDNKNLKFEGFRRKNGKVGIRNELWIVPTVGCVNGQAHLIANEFSKRHPNAGQYGPYVYAHNYGCSQLGEDHANTRKALADLINHPNAGGVLVLGLGCENNQITDLKKVIGSYDEQRVKFLTAQDVEDEIAEGIKLLDSIYQEIQHDQRTSCSLSELNIGLKCGGSDGLSGITANPLLGSFSDFMAAQGGTTILTEVPEMFGAEHLLMERAESPEIFEKITHLINGFKEYFMEAHQPVYENPSPGNKQGGISTLEDKSLGCTQKGGSSKIVDVLNYGQEVSKHGLNLLCGPGNDLVAASALGFSGCQLVLFTTGRGTPFGSFIPTMKISTNTALSQKKKNWIDFNAGKLLDEENSKTVLNEFINEIIAVANGKKLKHELSGSKEIAIFKTGITL